MSRTNKPLLVYTERKETKKGVPLFTLFFQTQPLSLSKLVSSPLPVEVYMLASSLFLMPISTFS